MICFQFSIFEPLDTTLPGAIPGQMGLWFAFNLVSLNHWTQLLYAKRSGRDVVICFQFSIFEPLDTTLLKEKNENGMLWFAFNLVSLNHWTQPNNPKASNYNVVICFQFSIFEPLDTTEISAVDVTDGLWFAFNLVSLNHWTQRKWRYV